MVVGGRVHGLGANARLGQGEFLVAEADESDGSFLKLSPTIAVVTTVDAEHLDHYADLDAIRAAFLAFVNKVPFYGSAVLCLDEPNIQRMIPRIEKRVVTYGLESGADLTARRLSFAGMQSRVRGRAPRQVARAGRRSRCPGRHNVLNALAAVAVGLDLEVPFEQHPAGARRLRGRPAPLPDPGRGRRACSSWTTTAITPPRSARPSPPPRPGSTGA